MRTESLRSSLTCAQAASKLDGLFSVGSEMSPEFEDNALFNKNKNDKNWHLGGKQRGKQKAIVGGVFAAKIKNKAARSMAISCECL